MSKTRNSHRMQNTTKRNRKKNSVLIIHHCKVKFKLFLLHNSPFLVFLIIKLVVFVFLFLFLFFVFYLNSTSCRQTVNQNDFISSVCVLQNYSLFSIPIVSIHSHSTQLQKNTTSTTSTTL